MIFYLYQILANNNSISPSIPSLFSFLITKSNHNSSPNPFNLNTTTEGNEYCHPPTSYLVICSPIIPSFEYAASALHSFLFLV